MAARMLLLRALDQVEEQTRRKARRDPRKK
jgi:hypothetical protein